MDPTDDGDVVLPKISSAKLLERQAEERATLKKRLDRIKSSIPRKNRNGRARAAEDAAEEEKRLLQAQKDEREEHGIAEEEFTEQFSHLSVSPTTTTSVEPTTSDEHKGESKAARRRRKKAELEAESNRRVEEARANMGPSPKMVEMRAIEQQLKPLSLRVHPIAADGHCLYGAVAHQMRETELTTKVQASVEGLRHATADHLLANRTDFMPFIETIEGDDDRFDHYCRTVRETAEWGGQVELRALAELLDTVIDVYAADMPVVRMGTAKQDGGAVLRVSFHRQYLGLGEHYNSVVHHV